MKKGNHYKRTPATLKILFDAIADGLTQRDAAVLAGISEDTLSLWKSDNSDFSEQIRKKEIECKLRNLKVIQRASEKSWQAAAWWLERKYQSEFSLKLSPRIEESNEALDAIAASLKTICEQR